MAHEEQSQHVLVAVAGAWTGMQAQIYSNFLNITVCFSLETSDGSAHAYKQALPGLAGSHSRAA